MDVFDAQNNAAFAALRHEAARKARQRRLLLTIYPVPWIIGGFFMSRATGQPALTALVISIHFTLMMIAMMACLFFFGGIEGYEASLAMKPFALDLWMSGTRPVDFAQAVIAHASGRYDRRRVRASALAMAAIFGAETMVLALKLPEFFTWYAAHALAPAAFLFVGFKCQEVFAVRNSRMWIGLVRRDYEEKFVEARAERDEPGRRRIPRAVRFTAGVVLALLGLGVVLVFDRLVFEMFTAQYISGGIRAGMRNRLALGAGFAAFHALAGGTAAWAMGIMLRPKAAGNLESLGEELYLLTRYRAQLKRA